MADVKSRPGQTRRERAAATRRRIIDRAYHLFCTSGYPATTMELIATEAGVATQTVHYVFGTKAALLREVVEVAAAGQHDPPPVMDREWIRDALATEDGRRAIALTVEHGVDIYARVAPLGTALSAAASIDPDIDTYWQGVAHARRRGMGEFVTALADKGQLRAGLTPDRATDVLFVLNSHETFLGLTRDSDWSIEAYKAWLYTTLCEQLLTDVAREDGDSAGATADLTFHHVLAAGGGR